jgi:hypothetical protein
MEDNYNSESNLTEGTKTSSTDSKNNSKTTGDSQVQDGSGIARTEQQEKAYEKSDEQQEYIEQANNNTEVANEAPVKDGKTLSMIANTGDDDDDDDEDDDDDPDTDIEVGDDPDGTKKKIPVF